MEQNHRDLIRQNYPELVSNIKSGVEVVSKDLLHRKIFTERVYEEIMAETTPIRKTEKLLDYIPLRGPDAFRALYESVLKCELYGAANLLNPRINHWNQPAN